MSAVSVRGDVQLRTEVVGLLGDGVRRQREMRWALRKRGWFEMSDTGRKRKRP